MKFPIPFGNGLLDMIRNGYNLMAGKGVDGKPALIRVNETGGLATGADAGRSIRAVTTSDSDVLPLGETRALLVTVAGDVALVMADDTDAVTVPLAVGLWPFAVKQVKATGTTATVFAVY